MRLHPMCSGANNNRKHVMRHMKVPLHNTTKLNQLNWKPRARKHATVLQAQKSNFLYHRHPFTYLMIAASVLGSATAAPPTSNTIAVNCVCSNSKRLAPVSARRFYRRRFCKRVIENRKSTHIRTKKGVNDFHVISRKYQLLHVFVQLMHIHTYT